MTEMWKVKVSNALRFVFSAAFWLAFIKVALILFVVALVLIQIPELAYDTLGDRPVIIESREDLDPQLLTGTSYARIEGSPTFENAFVYERYGLRFVYFTLEGYGNQIIARAYGQDVNVEEWKERTGVEGKLRPFDSQPFAYNIDDIFRDENGVPVPEDAYYLGVGDVPSVNAWQVGSISFALVLLSAMVYFFFFFRRGRQRRYFSDPLEYLDKDSA